VLYLRLILCGWLALTLTGCQTPPRACCRKPVAMPETGNNYATNSIYDLNAGWQDDNGQDFHLSELSGRPVVISMFFATCAGVCIITKDDMKTVEASLPAEVRDQTVFVLVTLDPARDSAADLKDYRGAEGLARARWRLLRGSPADTARLATALGIGYGRDHSGLFRHSSQVAVLNAAGKIVLRQDGIHADLAKTVAAIVALNPR
jgi:protein SCO1/2